MTALTPKFCTENLFPTCLTFQPDGGAKLCVKHGLCPRFKNKDEYGKAQDLLQPQTVSLVEDLKFRASAREVFRKDSIPPTQPKLNFNVKNFLAQYNNRFPCDESARVDLSKYQAEYFSWSIGEFNALIVTGRINKNDVLSPDEYVKVRDAFGSFWDKLPAPVKLGIVRIERKLLSDHVQVGVRARVDQADGFAVGVGLAVGGRMRVEQHLGQLQGGGEFPDPFGPREDPGMVEPPAAEACRQRLDRLCLAQDC